MEALPPETIEAPAPTATQPIAPWWHTLILIAAIGALSWQGAREFGGSQAGLGHGGSARLYATYVSTMISQFLMLGWVYVGLRLRKTPFRSLFGDLSGSWKSLLVDTGLAFGFWMVSVFVLGAINVTWMLVDAAIHHRSLIGPHGTPPTPDPAQQHVLHMIASLAPSNGAQLLMWALVCMTAGLVEEVVFRGYFLRQFTAWGKGAAVVGVALSSLLFGAAHGYQGLHYMVLLCIFGILFCAAALLRRNLRVGIFAHALNDFAMGVLLMVAKARHLL